MATSSVTENASFSILIELSPSEASVLKAMMQNPLGEIESDVERQIRITIFNSLHNIGVW